MKDGELRGKKILIGITGSIAAYKVIAIIRLLKKSGAEVNVVLTKNAYEFVTPLTLQTISQGKVYCDMFNRSYDLPPIKHISLANWADCILIAPATANIIAKLSTGIADDLLSTLALSAKVPITLAPAMNVNMWNNAIVRENVARLKTRGIHIWNPERGELACGVVDEGRLLAPGKIVANLVKLFTDRNDELRGKNILITAGPTYERIDPVRYIGNYSSGKMGYAMAEAFALSGADVTLISGPTALACSNEIRRIDVNTAQEMFATVMQQATNCDLFMAVAAVADFRPDKFSKAKIKKNLATNVTLTLVPNPDILATVAKMKDRPIVIGFAAETDNLEKNAVKKFQQKNLDMLIANLVGEDIGCGSDFNELKIITTNNTYELKREPKKILAEKVVNIIKQNFFGLSE
jgi:phosphopantothenoylcysteine decarboxylase/phosphopantothenate--cysteine ligase